MPTGISTATQPGRAYSAVELQCPCGQRVGTGSDIFRCACGAELGHMSDGVAAVGKATPYWGEIPAEQLERVLALGRETNWRDAVLQLAPALYDNAANPNRGAFEDILPVAPGALILDIGAGLGAISVELSRRHRVVALEGVAERARFIALRKQQEGLESLTVLNGDLHHIRFAERQFDAVIVNGVLEWAGLFDLDGSPRDVQVRFMQRMRRLIRPGGCVYVGIENRFGLPFFFGALDHSGLPYTSLMPRFLAHWICKRSGNYRSSSNHGYRTYIYSHRGFRKLFGEAGLRVRHVWIAPHSYNMPTDLVPLNRGAIEAYTRLRSSNARLGWVAALKNRIKLACAKEPLWRWFGPHFVFVLEGADA